MKAVLVVGSNCINREDAVRDALKFIQSSFRVSRKSDVYESPDCLGSGKKYLNAVVEIEVTVPVDTLEKELKAYERRSGRTMDKKLKGEVPIDIDIVICDGEVCRVRDFNARYFKLGYEGLRPN